MSRRKKKKHSEGGVELNLAAMLDMAFQLLAFFIMTFKPAPVEGQINLKLPPPQAIAGAKGQQAGNEQSNDPVQGVNTLTITLFSTPGGRISTMAVGEGNVAGVDALNGRLKAILGPDSGTSFDQIIIQVGSKLRYEELMKVVDVCTKQTLADGSKLSKLSFVELPSEAQ